MNKAMEVLKEYEIAELKQRNKDLEELVKAFINYRLEVTCDDDSTIELMESVNKLNQCLEIYR